MKFVIPDFRRPWLVALLVFALAAAPVAWLNHEWLAGRHRSLLDPAVARRDQDRLNRMASTIKDSVFSDSIQHQNLMHTWRRRLQALPVLDAETFRGEINADEALKHSRFRAVGVAVWSDSALRLRYMVTTDGGEIFTLGENLMDYPAIHAAMAGEAWKPGNKLSATAAFQIPHLGLAIVSMTPVTPGGGENGVLLAILRPADFLKPIVTTFRHRNDDGSEGAPWVQTKDLPGVGEGMVRVKAATPAEWDQARNGVALNSTIGLNGPMGELRLLFTPGRGFSNDPQDSRTRILVGAGFFIASLLALLAWVQARQRGMLTEEVRARTTELAKVHDELHHALEIERELVRMKSQFVNTVSHEFRTPLGVILSSADILGHYLDRLSAEQRAQHIQDIRDSSQHMSRLLEQVLSLGWLEAGKLACNAKPIDLASLLQRIADEHRSANGGNVRLMIDSHLTGAAADESLLRHILLNLLSNARKYSPVGAPIEFIARRDEKDVVLIVRDHGIGIPQEDLPDIFEAFTRASNVAEAPGTGLGLAIVRRCVTLHGGAIQLDSLVGEGTTITVRLPVFEDPAPPFPS